MNNYEKKYKEALDKAKAYDKALKVIKDNLDALNEIIETGAEVVNIQIIKNCFYRAFPELKGSEDEKIRKCVKYAIDKLFLKEKIVCNVHKNDVLAWLEKQGEQKPQGKTALEAINEEKVDNANKVKHKFNEGDWVVNRENKIGQIKALKKDKYNVLRYCIEWKDGKKTNPIQYYTDNYCHLWTLSDVKNGDILHSPSLHLIWIYKDNETAHVCVNMNYVKDNVFTEGLIVIPEDACPANKLQRDILFSKIKEAGYEWDADKKELKKIEKPIEWSYEDEANLNNIIWLCNNCIKGSETTWIPSQATKIKHLIETIKEKGLVQQNPAWSEEDKNLLELSVANLTELKDWFGKYYGRVGDCISWLNSLRNRVQPQPKQEWSKDDEVILGEIIDFFEKGTVKLQHDLSLYAAWLKSIKQRYTWKPSEKQINAIRLARSFVTDDFGNNPTLSEVLKELEEQLKKLK